MGASPYSRASDYTTPGLGASDPASLVREVQVGGVEGLTQAPMLTGYPEGLDTVMHHCLTLDLDMWKEIAERQDTRNTLGAIDMRGDLIHEIGDGSGSLPPLQGGGGSANCVFDQFEILRLVEVHPFGNFDISITSSTVLMLLALGFFAYIFMFMFNSIRNNGGIIPCRSQSLIEILYSTIVLSKIKILYTKIKGALEGASKLS